MDSVVPMTKHICVDRKIWAVNLVFELTISAEEIQLTIVVELDCMFCFIYSVSVYHEKSQGWGR